jgi:hypothetical protein
MGLDRAKGMDGIMQEGQTSLNSGIEDFYWRNYTGLRKQLGLYRTKKIDRIINRTKEANRIIQD